MHAVFDGRCSLIAMARVFMPGRGQPRRRWKKPTRSFASFAMLAFRQVTRPMRAEERGEDQLTTSASTMPARLQSAMKIVYEGGPDAAFERGLALIIGGLEKMRLTTNDIEVLKNVDE